MSKERSDIAPSNKLSAQYWHTKGHNVADKGDCKKAIEYYEIALKIDPSFGRAQNSIAWYLDKLDYPPKQVLDAYDKAIEIDPQCIISYANKAHKLVELGRPDEAIDCLQKAIDDNPNNAEAYNAMAFTLIALGKREEAIDFNKEIIRLDPSDDLNYYGMGTNLLELGKSTNDATYFAEAIIYFEDAIKINSKNYSYYINKAAALSNMGRNEEALAANEKAVELKPEHPDPYCCKGQILLALGREKEALQCLNISYEKSKTVKLEPDESIPYTQEDLDTLNFIFSIHRAALIEKYNDLQEATTETQESIDKLDASNPEVQEITKEFESLQEQKAKSMAQLFWGLDEKDADGVATSDRNSLAQVAEFMNQIEIIKQMVIEQHQKQAETETVQTEMKVTIDQHNARIEKLEFSHIEIRALKNQLTVKGVEGQQQAHLLEFLRGIKEKSEQQASKLSDINNDPYKSEFVYEFRHALNATYMASMAVQTDIVDNNKKSLLGNVGVAVETAGYVIPTIGAGLQFLGAVMSIIDQKQQEVLVARFAQIAADTNQMAEIASELAGILAQDEFDKNMLHDHASVMSKLPAYCGTFMQTTIGSNKSACEDDAYVETKSVSKVGKLKKSFFSVSIFKKKAAPVEEYEEKKEAVVPYKPAEEGKKDATILSSIIISKIFDGKVEAADRSSDSIVKAMVHSVSELFNMDEQSIEGMFASQAALVGETYESHHAVEVVEIGGGSTL